MSFLLDSDTCSAYLKNHPKVVGKAMLHFGALHVSMITVAELFTWALRAKAPPARLQSVRDLLKAVSVEDVSLAVAERFGELRAAQLDQGKTTPQLDLLIAATALFHNLTLVTHNTQDFANIPGLTVVDWLIP